MKNGCKHSNWLITVQLDNAKPILNRQMSIFSWCSFTKFFFFVGNEKNICCKLFSLSLSFSLHFLSLSLISFFSVHRNSKMIRFRTISLTINWWSEKLFNEKNEKKNTNFERNFLMRHRLIFCWNRIEFELSWTKLKKIISYWSLRR